ncbi:MAG: fibronectin type III domain-containing protein [Patescibacteria group bacterium]
MNNQKTDFKKLIIPAAIILILVAVVVFFDFVVKLTKPSGNANLSWNANMESDLAGYKIYYGTSPRTGDCPPGGYLKNLDAGKTATPDKPSYKVENLKENKTYYFSITSYDVSGNESCFSPEMSKSIF